MVAGASGAGKSSLLCAGLLPAVARGALAIPGSAGWPRLAMTATGDPLDELAAQIATVSGADAGQLRATLATAPERFDLSARQAVLAGAPGQPGQSGRLVLVVDQFEEIFRSSCGEDDRQAFITALHAAAARPWPASGSPPAVVILGVRGDFLVRCADYPLLRSAVSEPFLVTAMTEPELRRAITEPARAVGASVDGDLTDALLRELHGQARGGMAALPLLSHALAETWDKRDGARLTVAAYGRTGGIEHAVATSAQAVYDALRPAERPVARAIFTRLASVSEDGTEVSSPATREELAAGHSGSGAVTAIVEGFAQRRLLTVDGDIVQLAHEALLRTWPLLRQWLADDQAKLQVAARLRHASRDWDEHGRDNAYLYSGRRLEAAREATGELGAGKLEHAFLAMSERSGRRRQSLRRAIAASLAVLLITAIWFAAQADIQASSVRSQRDLAISRELTAESAKFAGTNPVLSRLLSLAAWRVDRTPEARLGMLKAAAQPGVAALQGNPVPADSVAFSPDRRMLAVGYDNGVILLWDLAHDRRAGRPLHAVEQQVTGLAFSQDDRTLTSCSNDIVQRWDIKTGREIEQSPDYLHGKFGTAALGPAGDVVAIAYDSGQVRFIDTSTGRRARPPMTIPGGDNQLAFAPGGNVLAVMSDVSSQVTFWDIATRHRIGPRLAQVGAPGVGQTMAFSPDGRLLAAAALNGQVQLWDLTTGRLLSQAFDSGLTVPVSSVAFSPDGLTLATGGNDGYARLWNVAADGPLLTRTPYEVDALAFGSDGRELAFGTAVGRVFQWNLAKRHQDGPPVTIHAGPVTAVAFGPGGKTLITDAGSGTTHVRIWSLPSRRQKGPPVIDNIYISRAQFSGDGQTFADYAINGQVSLANMATGLAGRTIMTSFAPVSAMSFSADGHLLAMEGDINGVELVRLWDLATRRLVGPVITTGEGSSYTGPGLAVALSPDGRILATADFDGGVQLWDVSSGQRIGVQASTARVTALAFSPDGRALAVGGTDGGVRLLDTTYLTDVTSSLCANAPTSLSAEQWALYASGVPYQRICPARS